MDLGILLPAMFVIPFAGGVLCWYTERLSLGWPRWIGLLSMTATLLIALFIWLHYDLTSIAPQTLTAPQWLLEYQLAWIPRFGISFHLGIDGLSVLLIVLTAILGVLSVACSWREIQRHVGFFHLCLLWNLAGVIGVFMALDLFLFFLLWEVMLVPMYFLIALWGHGAGGKRGRIYAATKFFIFTQASGLIMLVAILALVWMYHAATGSYSFDYEDLLALDLPGEAENWLMLGFFVAFAVKLPAFPFHPWLPDAHSQAPTAGSVDLAGVLLKTGAYGLMRFVLPLFPEASADFAEFAMTLGVIGILYGAMLAMVQTDIKRLVAYTSVSHMGFVLVGIYAGNITALQGAVILMLAHGAATGALFILCGELYERIHSRQFEDMGGLAQRAPYYAMALMFFSIASLGLPGLGNFVGEFLVLLGTFPINPVLTSLAAAGLIAAAIYSLYLIQRALHGPARDPEPLEDLNFREKLMMVGMMIVLLWLGLYPQPIFDAARAPLEAIATIFARGGS